MTLTLVQPNGEETPEPSTALLRSIVFERDEAYWQAGSADAGLYFESNSIKSQLVITHHTGLGFCVLFEPGPTGMPRVISASPDESLVDVSYVGNPTKMPKSHFVPPRVALDAIIAFTHSGRPVAVPDAQWITFSPEDP